MTFHTPSPFGIYARSKYVYALILYKYFYTPCEIITECLGTPNVLDKIDETIKTQTDTLNDKITTVEQKNVSQDTAIAGKVDIAQSAENAGKVLTVSDNGDVTPMVPFGVEWESVTSTLSLSTGYLYFITTEYFPNRTSISSARDDINGGMSESRGYTNTILISPGSLGFGVFYGYTDNSSWMTAARYVSRTIELVGDSNGVIKSTSMIKSMKRMKMF